MATRVTSTRPETKKGAGGGPKPPGPNGKGPGGNGFDGKQKSRRRLSAAAYRITVWAVLAAVVMMFAALSSAYIILAGGINWRPVTMPRMFYVSTGIIIASSVCLELSKRYLKKSGEARYRRWLNLTLLLGFLFLVAQLLGWRELAAQGVYFQADPRRSFFYLFTAVHGVHLIGGIIALVYLLVKGRKEFDWERFDRVQTSASLVSLYWHTMDVLWLWLFGLLLLWR